MARYTAAIESRLAPSAAFAYMASFDNAREWDPSVTDARRLDAGALAVGSSFSVVSRFAGRSVPLVYEITRLDEPRLVTLTATKRAFASVDTIVVEPHGAGSRVIYEARLDFRGAARLAEPLMQALFRRIGARAAASLRTELNRSR